MVDGKVAGNVALEFQTLSRDEYQVSFVLGRDYWDPDSATETLYRTVKFGFDELNLDGTFTKTESNNHVMTQVIESDRSGTRPACIATQNSIVVHKFE